MLTIFYIVLGFIIFIVAIAFIWRFTSLPCPAWLGWLVEMDNPFFKNSSTQAIIQHLNLQPGMRVLDYGCGPGRLTIPIAKQIGPAGEVMALDIQSDMLKRVRRKAQLENLGNIQFMLKGAGESKLDNERFDRVLLVTVLGEIPEQCIALKKIFASLKPGGFLSITEIIADPHFQSRKNVTQVANSVGFVEKDFFGNRLTFTINFEKP